MSLDQRSNLERNLSIAHRALWRASQQAGADVRLDGVRIDLQWMAQHVHEIHTEIAHGPQHPGQMRFA